MTDATSVRWGETDTGDDYRRRRLAALCEALLVGLLAGMAGFAYNAPQFVTLGVDRQLLIVPVFAAGAFAHLFAPTLRSSIRLALAALFVGLAVLVLSWIAPLLVLPYPPAARDALLRQLVRNATTVAFVNFAPAYLGSYLLAVCVGAIWE